ncbi:hypothetical protein KKF05_05895 [Patescibacteria group bacterium]|nr:hypothetical protein [Patescibacteria group bacterium]MBU1028689.1 hypothetical protein [Patescibacteria group bacterium]
MLFFALEAAVASFNLLIVMLVRTFGSQPLERLLGIYSRRAEFLTAVAMSILLTHWLLIMWFIVSRLGSLEFLRLHYTAALGIDWIDVWWKIFVFPGAGLAVIVINGLLSGALVKSYQYLGLLLMSLTILLQIFFMIGGVMAMLLNG